MFTYARHEPSEPGPPARRPRPAPGRAMRGPRGTTECSETGGYPRLRLGSDGDPIMPQARRAGRSATGESKLQRALDKLGMSQADLARKADIHPRAISAIARG